MVFQINYHVTPTWVEVVLDLVEVGLGCHNFLLTVLDLCTLDKPMLDNQFYSRLPFMSGWGKGG